MAKFIISLFYSIIIFTLNLLIILLTRYKLVITSISILTLVILSYYLNLTARARSLPVWLDYRQDQVISLSPDQRQLLLNKWEILQRLQPHSKAVSKQLQSITKEN